MARCDDESLGRHRAHQMVELRLDHPQVVEDVRVIELQVVHDQGTRTVVDELGAFVEEGRVVLIRLHHEEGRFAQAGGLAEILRDTADQKTGLETGILEDPGEHAGGGGLAMGARYGQYPAPLQHMFRQPLGTRGIGQPLIEQVLHRRIAPRHGVAHHHHIRRRLQVLGPIALHQLDAGRCQLGAHGGIDIGVRSADLMAQRPGQQGDTAHERSADTEDMEMHQIATGKKRAAINQEKRV